MTRVQGPRFVRAGAPAVMPAVTEGRGVHTDLAACVAITILVGCTWANAVGALVPLAAQKVGIDPTVVSTPLIPLVDAYGLFNYFTAAHLMSAQWRG